jgi:hypothetical protein
MDWVGFEPTTLAAAALLLYCSLVLKLQLCKEESIAQKNMYWKPIDRFVILLENYTAKYEDFNYSSIPIFVFHFHHLCKDQQHCS